MPGGPPVVGLFGGALVLVALSHVGLDGNGEGDTRPVLIAIGDVVAFGFILGSGVVLVGGLRISAEALERRTREVEEAGSRLQVLVEHVPAAVYIDLADPEVSDGGRLAYMSPQISPSSAIDPRSSSAIRSS